MLLDVGNIGIFLMMFLSLNFPTKCLFISQNDVDYTQDISTNDQPIIGILTEEILNPMYSGPYKSYIAASYVKFIEGAGGRVAPIWIGQNDEYYRNILGKLNGVLWPGGNAYFDSTKGYAEAGYRIYRIAKEMNEAGDYFPIFGICLGFELLTYVAANNVEHRINCSSSGQALPLNFKTGYNKSRLFKYAPWDIIEILRTESVTINFHEYCVNEKGLAKVGLTDDFQVISCNSDRNGVKFVSSLEHVNYPFYGLQFHPEKNIYEWIKGRDIPHTANAIRVSQYFADFFLHEVRKSHHHFSNSSEESHTLIYNYPILYTGIKGSPFEQCYVFLK